MQPRGDERQRCLRFELTTQPRARVLRVSGSARQCRAPFRHPEPPLAPLDNGRRDCRRRAHAVHSREPARHDVGRAGCAGGIGRALALRCSPATSRARRRCSPSLRDELHWQRDADPLTLMRRLTSALFHTFTYAQSETRVDSPIDDALKARGGVCQDLAHIMIALARRIGIPCRYVSGYLSTSSERHDRSTEGATHAWAEAYLPELGWVGFDPTNDLLAFERHIRAAVGRDYADVPPTRGVFRGEAGSELAVLVTVSLADSPTRPDRVMPMMTWVAPAVAEPDAADQQQEQQQQ